MKKMNAKTTKSPQRARTAILTEQNLTAVVGGTGGTIISQSVLGVGGTGLTGVGGTGLTGISGGG